MVRVVGVLGAGRILDATFINQPGEQGRFLAAAAEAHAGNANLSIWILTSPLLGLLNELFVHLFSAFIHGVASHAIKYTRERLMLLRTRARNIAEADIRVASLARI